jgi:hypothetical protein
MMLFVDPESPTKFVQKVSGTAPDFEMVPRDGAAIQLPLDDEAADGNKDHQTSHSEI